MSNLPDFTNYKALDLLQWAEENIKGKVGLSCSFSVEDIILIDLWTTINPSPYIFTLDTGRLPQETYDVIEKVREQYKVQVHFFYPHTGEVEKMVNEHGPNLFYRSVELRKLCCAVRKIHPLQRAMKDLSGWICGLRKSQSITRQNLQKVEIDEQNNHIYKINPLLEWSDTEIWNYVREHNVPYNALHDKGYPSLGCLPCTRPVKEGEDIRAGRWWWENPETKECGLHQR